MCSKEFEDGDDILEMLAKRQLLQFYSTYSALGDLANNSGGSTPSTEPKGEPYAQNVATKFFDATLFYSHSVNRQKLGQFYAKL